MLESNPLTTQPIFDHPQAIHDPNTGFIHPLIHMYPWKGVSSLSNMVPHHLLLKLKNLNLNKNSLNKKGQKSCEKPVKLRNLKKQWYSGSLIYSLLFTNKILCLVTINLNKTKPKRTNGAIYFNLSGIHQLSEWNGIMDNFSIIIR